MWRRTASLVTPVHEGDGSKLAAMIDAGLHGRAGGLGWLPLVAAAPPLSRLLAGDAGSAV